MSKDNTILGPMTLQPVFVERIWGTRDLGPWFPASADDKPIGEAWLTAESCHVEGTETTLAQLSAETPLKLGNETGDGFPLLIKFLYPREKLSVQVHPNDAEAKALGQPRGKTECWYVLSAEPGAQVAVGLQEPLSAAQLRSAIEDGSIESRLRYLSVKTGDMIFVDAGTVHAIGPGMVVLETQQYSDVTYRLWDYGRPRELHVDAGVAVTRSQTSAGLVAAEQMEGFTRLVSCDYFRVDRFALASGDAVLLLHETALQILIALGEGAAVVQNGHSVPLTPGCATLLPAEGTSSTLSATDKVEVIRILR